MSELDDVLGELQEGVLESSGAFTLDWARARHKYAAESLKYPDRYLRLLLTFVGRTGATQLQILEQGSEVRWQWQPSLALPRNSWENCLKLLENGALPAREEVTYELQLMLQMLAGRDDLALRLEYPGLGRLCMGPDHLHQEPYPLKAACCSFRIVDASKRPKSRSIMERLTGFFVNRSWPEMADFIHSPHYPKFPIYVHGTKLITRLKEPEFVTFCWAVVGPSFEKSPLGMPGLPQSLIAPEFVDCNGNVLRNPPEWTSRHGVLHLHSLLTLGYRLKPPEGFHDGDGSYQLTFPRNFQLFQDGLEVYETRSPIGGLSITLGYRGLRLDASGRQAVEGDELGWAIASVSRLICRFFREAERAARDLSIWTRFLHPGQSQNLEILLRQAQKEILDLEKAVLAQEKSQKAAGNRSQPVRD